MIVTFSCCVSQSLEPAIGELVDSLPLDLVDSAANVEDQCAAAAVDRLLRPGSCSLFTQFFLKNQYSFI